MSALPSTLSADELALRLNQQELVAGFGLFALEPGPIARLLDEACRLVGEGLHTCFAKVLQFRPETNDFLVVAGIGWRPGTVGHATLPGGLDSPAGYTVDTGRPTLTTHLSRERRFQIPALLAQHGVESAINVVIGQPGQLPFGVLEADSTRRHDFIAADQAFLQAIANILTAGLARLRAEDATTALVAEKDLLIKEVHHRISNSLQLVQSILSLQARTASPEARRELEGAAGRITSIAGVHRRLHEAEAGSQGDVPSYLRALLADLADLTSGSIDLEADSLSLHGETLASLGLVVTELVLNAAKHGSGRVAVEVRHAPPGLRVVVTDEGPGLAAAPDGRTGLGLRLVRSLAKGDPTRSVHLDPTASHGRATVLMTL